MEKISLFQKKIKVTFVSHRSNWKMKKNEIRKRVPFYHGQKVSGFFYWIDNWFNRKKEEEEFFKLKRRSWQRLDKSG